MRARRSTSQPRSTARRTASWSPFAAAQATSPGRSSAAPSAGSPVKTAATARSLSVSVAVAPSETRRSAVGRWPVVIAAAYAGRRGTPYVPPTGVSGSTPWRTRSATRSS